VDLGTANTLVYVRGRGIVLNEPSVVAVKPGRSAVGRRAEASAMIGRTPSHIQAIRPLKDGVIADFEICEKMLRYFIHRCTSGASPSRAWSSASRRVSPGRAARRHGGRRVRRGAQGLHHRGAHGRRHRCRSAVHEPTGNMVVDIGGGTTEVAVISLGGS